MMGVTVRKKPLCSWLGLEMLLCFNVALAEKPIASSCEIVSNAGNYRLKFDALSGETTGIISLVDESTSAVVADINVGPGRLRSRPRAVWRGDTSDVAIELDTHNPCSPAYIVFDAQGQGSLGLSHGTLRGLSGYLGIDARQITRARYVPVKWVDTPRAGAQIIEMREQCWDKNDKRYTRVEPVLIDADGSFRGR